MLCFLLALVAIVADSSLAQIDCTGLPDGAHGWGCRSFTQCTDGKGTVVDCQFPGWAFDHRTGKCEPWDTVLPPCGQTLNNCTDLDDGLYPVLPDCTYFYTCHNGEFLGASPCNSHPTEGELRFDPSLQICNWHYNIPPPCGTKEEVDPSTTDETLRSFELGLIKKKLMI